MLLWRNFVESKVTCYEKKGCAKLLKSQTIKRDFSCSSKVFWKSSLIWLDECPLQQSPPWMYCGVEIKSIYIYIYIWLFLTCFMKFKVNFTLHSQDRALKMFWNYERFSLVSPLSVDCYNGGGRMDWRPKVLLTTTKSKLSDVYCLSVCFLFSSTQFQWYRHSCASVSASLPTHNAVHRSKTTVARIGQIM